MPLCDTLLRVAEEGLYRLHFSQEILSETTRNLVQKDKMTEEKAVRYQEQVKNCFPESMVEGYESFELLGNEQKNKIMSYEGQGNRIKISECLTSKIFRFL